MASYHYFTILIATISILSVGNGAKVNIHPTLTLRDAEGSTFTPVQELGDMTGYTTFIDFLKITETICAVGVWIFYPDINYQMTTGAAYQIGDSQQSNCTVLTPAERILLAASKSYRHIGPETDLSARSIVLYEKPFFAGPRHEVLASEGSMLNIPSLFNVGSYVITAETHDDAVNEADAQKTLIKLFLSNDATDAGPRSCLVLMNLNSHVPPTLSKMFLRSQLTARDYFGSLEFHPYSPQVISPIGVCVVPAVHFIDLPETARIEGVLRTIGQPILERMN